MLASLPNQPFVLRVCGLHKAHINVKSALTVTAVITQEVIVLKLTPKMLVKITRLQLLITMVVKPVQLVMTAQESFSSQSECVVQVSTVW